MGVTIFSPAKVNLFLAVTGRRADGFHDLVSVAAPLEFGDTLEAELVSRQANNGVRATLACDDPGVPLDETNLVLKAARLFAEATGWDGSVRFILAKRIPLGAGLGGGSSNGVAALRALNALSGDRASEATLARLAAALGSDCALFLAGVPVVMRGRGECLERLPPAAAARLRGRRLLVFKPSFAISTPWAYSRMVTRGSDYLPAEQAEAKLAHWTQSSVPAEQLLYNNMEPAAFEKYLALPVLLEALRRDFGLLPRMSGSGSACFMLLDETCDPDAIGAKIRTAWGEPAFVRVTRIA